jgi:hypothetical protein
MRASRRRAAIRAAFSVAFLALFAAAPAAAQENIDAGKTPAQLYAQDCAICHKTPYGLSKAGGSWQGLQGFLREHYTASKESAAAISAYLIELDRKAPQRKPSRARRHAPGTEKDRKAGARLPPHKPAEAKSEAKPAGKPDEAKAESKSGTKSQAKTEVKSEAKTGAEGADAKKPDAKASDAKASGTKTSGTKTSGKKPDKKTD